MPRQTIILAAGIGARLGSTDAGIPKPPGDPIRAAKIVAWTAPAESIAGPPEFPWRILPRTAVIVRSTEPLP